MEQLEKTEYLNLLFGYYQELLTEKQQTYFTMYYHEDNSLFEIAEALNVSRNAVYDQLKITEKHLIDFESKLHLYEQAKKRKELLNELETSKDLSLIEALRKLDE